MRALIPILATLTVALALSALASSTNSAVADDARLIGVFAPFRAGGALNVPLVSLQPEIAECAAPSLIAGYRPDAFRCTAQDGTALDPCFAGQVFNRTVLACAPSPWAPAVLVSPASPIRPGMTPLATPGGLGRCWSARRSPGRSSWQTARSAWSRPATRPSSRACAWRTVAAARRWTAVPDRRARMRFNPS